MPLSARPGHGPAVPSSSAPGPPPGLRSLVRRAAVSAPPSSPASRSSPGPVALAAACGEAPWAERARRAKLARQGCRCISPDGDCSKPSRGVGVSGLGETGFKAMTDARPRGGGASACRCAWRGPAGRWWCLGPRWAARGLVLLDWSRRRLRGAHLPGRAACPGVARHSRPSMPTSAPPMPCTGPSSSAFQSANAEPQ